VKYGIKRHVFKDVFRRVMICPVREIRFPKMGERILLSEVFSLNRSIPVFSSGFYDFD
jgi:hypothetical protein